MRRFAAVLGLLLTAALLWWVGTSDSGEDAPAPPTPVDAPDPAPPPATQGAKSPRSVDAPAQPATEPTTGPPRDAEPADGPIHVSGSACFTDDDEPLQRFEFRFWRTDESMRRNPRAQTSGTRVHGIDGRFRAVLPAAGRYAISTVTARGVEHDTVSEFVDVGPGEEIRIEVVRSPVARIQVVDEGTREPISGARVHAVQERLTAGPWRAYPGTATQRGTPLWTDGDGFVDLGRGLRARRWFVVADGYAWLLATIRPQAKVSHMVVALKRGGTLELAVERFEELEDPHVYTLRETDAQYTELPLPDVYGRAVYTGLRPGRHRVTVRRGKSSSRDVVFATGQVTIEVGQVAQLRLDAKPVEKRPRTRAVLTVNVPESWGALPTEVWVRGTTPGTAQVNQRSPLRDLWDGRTATLTTDELPLGEYAIELSPYQWRRAVTIGHDARLQVRLGEPGVVRVQVLDDATGKVIPGASVFFTTVMDGLDGWNGSHAGLASNELGWTVRAGPGTVTLHVDAPRYIDPEGDAATVLELKPGEIREHTIRLRRGGTVHVALHVEGEPFQVPGASIDIRPVGHSEDTSWSASAGPRGLQEADFPGLVDGTYAVTVTGITGYAPVAERTVTVVAGKTSAITFDLRRSR